MNEKEFDRKWDPIYKKHLETIHDEPSPETRERLARLETNQTNIMEKLEEIVARFDKFEDKLDNALEKKAGIWVEKVLIWVGVIIGGGLLAYLGKIIIKVIEL